MLTQRFKPNAMSPPVASWLPLGVVTCDGMARCGAGGTALSYDVELGGGPLPTARKYRDARNQCGAVARAHAASAPASRQPATQKIVVEITDAARFARLRAEWSDLVERAAEPNVFMDPALVQTAVEANATSRIQVLLAWSGQERLVGVWAFRLGHPRKSPLPGPVLNAPQYVHGLLATPVIDRACLDEVLHAMLDTVAAAPHLPKIIALDLMGMEGAVMEALTRVLAARDSAPRILESFRRPKLASPLDGKAYLEKTLSSSSRKKLRQHRRRLAEKGDLTRVICAEPQAVRGAFEEFLTLEAAGWKGKQGTALLCNESDKAFVRAAIATLAEQGCAWIDALHLNGRPVSMQIIARCGPAAFTWKTAYDERFHDFSPGMLLLEDYTASLLADTSVAFVDSCSHSDSGFMAAWSERQPVADLWIDARRGGSLAFRFLSGLQKGYRDLRAAAKNAYHALRRLRVC